MAKYRILEEERGDGAVFFVPQVKHFLFWLCYWRGYHGDERVEFSSLSGADGFIKDQKGSDDHSTVTTRNYYEA